MRVSLTLSSQYRLRDGNSPQKLSGKLYTGECPEPVAGAQYAVSAGPEVIVQSLPTTPVNIEPNPIGGGLCSNAGDGRRKMTYQDGDTIVVNSQK